MARIARRGRREIPRRPGPATDDDLVARAVELLDRRYVPGRHTVAAAVRTRSGAIYVGVNIEGIHTPCAEPVAVGAAVTAGESSIEAMVAVGRRGSTYHLLAPCGTCRQLLFDYAPRGYALVPGRDGRWKRLSAQEALPSPFATFGD